MAARLLFGDGSARWDGDLAHRVSVPKWVDWAQSRIPEAMPVLPGALVGAPEASAFEGSLTTLNGTRVADSGTRSASERPPGLCT